MCVCVCVCVRARAVPRAFFALSQIPFLSDVISLFNLKLHRHNVPSMSLAFPVLSLIVSLMRD